MAKVLTVTRTFLVLALVGLHLPLLAQINGRTRGETEETYIKDTRIIKSESVILQDLDSAAMGERPNVPVFTGISRQALFYDKNQMKAIQQAMKKTSLEGLNEQDRLLTGYISQFSPRNFREDSEILWRAGNVKEQLGDTAAALFYYQLAYKHNPFGFPISKLDDDTQLAPYFDPSTGTTLPVREMVSRWEPLERYYEILEIRQQIDTLRPPKVLVRMGGQINTPHPEYAPYTHFSDSILVFTSRREVRDFSDPFARKNEDLFISYKYHYFDSAYWDTSMVMPDAINTKFNEGSACLSPDGRTLYFTRCGEGSGGLGDCDLYEAHLLGPGKWGKVENLGAQVNSPYWDSQPNITEDGTLLFFSSNRSGGFGGTDLYVSQKDEKGRWMPARNLGPVINTHQNEVTPFFHRINKTLYFSSNGQITSYGNFDIYKSRKQFESWEEPKNVGPLVNTAGNEYYFSIDGRAENIFYSRSEGQKSHLEQDFDLYSFEMPMEARPDATTLVKGYLLDSQTGKPLIGTVWMVDQDNGVEIAPKMIRKDGYFEFELRKNNRYRLYVAGNNFLTVKNDLNVEQDTTFQVLVESLNSKRPIVFESLEFRSNSYQLKDNVKPQLDYLVEFLTRYPMFTLKVEGHTDSDGDADKNYLLSLRRAKSIADYIISNGGFSVTRVEPIGYGETRPLVPNDTDDNKRINRRVEFKLFFDPEYEGDRPLPTKEELFFRKETAPGPLYLPGVTEENKE